MLTNKNKVILLTLQIFKSIFVISIVSHLISIIKLKQIQIIS